MEEQVYSDNPRSTSDQFMAINFSVYNTPKFSEVPGKEWIHYGQDNQYPNYLIESLNKSATHNAIIESKIKQIVGDGIAVEDSSDSDQYAKIMSLIKKTNKYECFNDIIRKIAFDLEVFGGFALNLIWSRDRTSIASISHIDFSTIRVGKPNEETGEVDHYWVSDNWKSYQKPKYKPVKIAAFNSGNRIEASTILYIKPYRANTLWYPIPSYIGGMNYIELDYQVSNYQLNSVKNGLSPSLMINFNNGQPTQPEREEIYRSINANFTGSDNAGKFMLFFNKNKDSAATVEPIQINELDKIYTVLNESISQNICTAHRITSTGLMGISTPGSLGTSQELLLASELFYNTVISPEQTVIEEVLNKILAINGFTLQVYLKDVQPISFQASEDLMQVIMTKDEIRKKLGLPNLTEDQKAELLVPAAPAKSGAIASTGTTATGLSAEPAVINDTIRGLSGREHQQLLRIIRQYGQGKLTKEAASVLLKSGLGLSDDDITHMLPDVEDETMEVQAPTVPKYNKEVETKTK